MATITETGIRDVVVSVLRPDPALPIQMLVTVESHDAAGNTVRRVQFPDWWDRLTDEDKALIQGLYERFTAAACAALEITSPPGEPLPNDGTDPDTNPTG